MNRGGRKCQKARTVRVGKRGSVVISNDLVDGLGISPPLSEANEDMGDKIDLSGIMGSAFTL